MTQERDDLDIFDRYARRHIRNHVRDRQEVPALAVVVSRGWNPRKIETQMALHLLEDGLSVRATVEQMLREHSSRYAAVCSLERSVEALLFAAFDANRVVKWHSGVSAHTGLAGWEPSTFQFAEAWAMDLIARTVV